MDKKEIKKYDEVIEREAKKFRLTGEDLHNLFDIFYMISWGDMKLNKMDKWASKFSERLDEIILHDMKPIPKDVKK